MERKGWGFKAAGDSPSSVMVPLLEPPLLLDCRWEDEEDTEDSAAWPLGEGEGVRVGEVLLEVVDVPEGGLLLVSSFCTKEDKYAASTWKVEVIKADTHNRVPSTRHRTRGMKSVLKIHTYKAETALSEHLQENPPLELSRGWDGKNSPRSQGMWALVLPWPALCPWPSPLTSQ